MDLILYRTRKENCVKSGGEFFRVSEPDWDALINRETLGVYLREEVERAERVTEPEYVLAPLGSQEVWAAGVTYYRSRTARMEESRDTGGGDFYDRVYDAERPEIFLKATPQRVADPGADLRLRRDSRWIVPEPELTLAINRRHEIIGYTVGNDLSCRDIEGENPLYLPQAKIFDACASVGPGLLIRDEPLPKETRIELEVLRDARVVVNDRTDLGMLKRDPRELVAWLTRETSFPQGCFLMTGTGIVPDDDFSLKPGDEVRITIDPIGTLVNTVTLGA